MSETKTATDVAISSVNTSTQKSIEQRLVMQYSIARVLAEASSIVGAAKQVMQLVCETIGWEFGALWRVETESLTLTNEGVWHADSIDLSVYAETIRYSVLNRDDLSLPGFVFNRGKPLWLSCLQDFHSQDSIDAVKAGLQSAFFLPVHSSGNLIAILACLSQHSQIQDPTLTALMNAVCNQIGIFLERKRFEEELKVREKQHQLLAQIGLTITDSVEYEQRLQAILHVIVPDLADWCAIDLIDQNNILRRVAAAHVDPSKEPLLYQIQPTRHIDPDAAHNPQFETLRTGKSLLITDIPFSLIRESIEDAERLKIARQLDPRSSIVVPMIAHGRILGLCTWVNSDSMRRYFPTDLALAEEIVQRAALALDNAQLYAISEKHNAELEYRVNERTAQLKLAINELKNQIGERQIAENQVRVLNVELEQRIAERTSQLQDVNRHLQKVTEENLPKSQMLSKLLQRTRELYRISQAIGTVHTPNAILSVLLRSSYLKDASRASIAILAKPWKKGGTPPEDCFILAEWNRDRSQPKFLNRHFTLEEYGLVLPIPYKKLLVTNDIQSVMELPEAVRKRFADLKTHSLIILPLVAGGEWFGLLSLHFKTHRITPMEDLNHMRGLVNEMAIVISSMRLLEAESKARLDAEKANAIKLRFLGMISHELRTPLTSIKGFATTLLAEDVTWPAEKQRDFLETINRESDLLYDLIEQLLDLSRLEAGTLRISPEKMSLKKIFESAFPELQTVTPKHELVLDIPSNLPVIFGDEHRIAQVLINLVGNAARYSPAGTQIILSAHRSGKMVQVDVADHGPGIPREDRLRVFEAFRQLDNETGKSSKGAGLGLAICKGLIEAQHGKIWIQDQRAPGTVVSFTLPIWREAQQ